MIQTDALPKRWDPIVKITHWGIATAIIANAVFTEEGSGWHIWVGYGLAGLLGLRLLWGLVGPANARFTAFPPSPLRAMRYLQKQFSGRHEANASHNPLGALMVYALWSCLAVTIATGIAMSGPPPANPTADRSENEAMLSNVIGRTVADASEEKDEIEESGTEEAEPGLTGGEHEDEGEEWLEEIHEAAVNLLYLLVVLHILGVVVETVRHGRGTVKSMLPFSSRRMR